jgi:hypothetical protein
MDNTEIERCVTILLGYWPSPAATQPELLALAETLGRYDVTDFDRAIDLLIRQDPPRQFRPVPAELWAEVRKSHFYLEDLVEARTPPLPESDRAATDRAAANRAGVQAAVEALVESQRRLAAGLAGDELPAPSEDELHEQLRAAPRVNDQYAIWEDPSEEPRNLLYKCNTCQDSGFKTLDHSGQGTVKPCPSCRPEQHARWAVGYYMPDWLGGGRAHPLYGK